MKVKDIIQKLESLETPRSNWKRGVLYYAFYILKKIPQETEIESEKDLLNGAKNWKHASYSGCFNVEDEVIALSVCSNSELRKTNYGRRRPNRDESWLDVQARALFQASNLILSIIKNQ